MDLGDESDKVLDCLLKIVGPSLKRLDQAKETRRCVEVLFTRSRQNLISHHSVDLCLGQTDSLLEVEAVERTTSDTEAVLVLFVVHDLLCELGLSLQKHLATLKDRGRVDASVVVKLEVLVGLHGVF